MVTQFNPLTPLQRSYGCIIFRKTQSGPKYLVLRHRLGHHDFPKGFKREEETEEEAARRETAEETGITQLKIYPDFKTATEYYIKTRVGLVRKRVVFFLAETNIADVKLEPRGDGETTHVEYSWLNFDQAMSTINRQNLREALFNAHQFLQIVEASN